MNLGMHCIASIYVMPIKVIENHMFLHIFLNKYVFVSNPGQVFIEVSLELKLSDCTPNLNFIRLIILTIEV